MSPSCTSLAVLTRILACFPRVHSCVQLRARLLHAQRRKSCVLMPCWPLPTLQRNVTHWHRNGFGRLKHRNCVCPVCSVWQTWQLDSPDMVWLMCVPPQKWSSWTGTRRGSHPKDDMPRGTLFRYRHGWLAVRSAERPQRNVGFMINGKRSRCLTLFCALVLSLPIFLSDSSQLYSPFPSLILFILCFSSTFSYLILYLKSLILYPLLSLFPVFFLLSVLSSPFILFFVHLHLQPSSCLFSCSLFFYPLLVSFFISFLLSLLPLFSCSFSWSLLVASYLLILSSFFLFLPSPLLIYFPHIFFPFITSLFPPLIFLFFFLLSILFLFSTPLLVSLSPASHLLYLCPQLSSSLVSSPLSSTVCSFQRLHWPAGKPHPQHGSSG